MRKKLSILNKAVFYQTPAPGWRQAEHVHMRCAHHDFTLRWALRDVHLALIHKLQNSFQRTHNKFGSDKLLCLPQSSNRDLESIADFPSLSLAHSSLWDCLQKYPTSLKQTLKLACCSAKLRNGKTITSSACF